MNLASLLHLDLGSVSALTFLAVFVAGVITSFTPCVYPIIPVIVGYIGARSGEKRSRTLILLVFYSIGLAVNFSILGLVASLTGRLFGQLQSSPIAYIIVGNIIIFFGLSLVGVFSIPLPNFSKKTHSEKGTIFGAFGLGFASGLVAAPCTSAVLGALLAYVATRQNLLVGSLLLFTFALGLSTLLIIVGVTSREILKAPGLAKFSEILEKAFAYLLILLGEYFIFKAGMLSV